VLRKQCRQRWKTETVISVAAYKWDEELSSRRREMPKAHVLLRA
jgi:hypothetical protein